MRNRQRKSFRYPDVRNYTYTFFEGKLYYRENSEMVRQKVSPTAEGVLRALMKSDR